MRYINLRLTYFDVAWPSWHHHYNVLIAECVKSDKQLAHWYCTILKSLNVLMILKKQFRLMFFFDADSCILQGVFRLAGSASKVKKLKVSCKSIFTVRRYALNGICDRNSVSLSICLSVCLSHSWTQSWTVSTWFDLRSWFIHPLVAPSF